MPKDWIEVTDTALKIGLGSLISGTSAYLGLRHSSKSNKKRFLLEHKIKILEEIAIEIEVYFNALSNLMSNIAGCSTYNENYNLNSFSKNQFDTISENDMKLIESWFNKNSATSKLRLLKTTTSLNHLHAISELEKELRNLLIFKKVYIDLVKIDEIKSTYKGLKENFHNSLADYYECI